MRIYKTCFIFAILSKKGWGDKGGWISLAGRWGRIGIETWDLTKWENFPGYSESGVAEGRKRIYRRVHWHEGEDKRKVKEPTKEERKESQRDSWIIKHLRGTSSYCSKEWSFSYIYTFGYKRKEGKDSYYGEFDPGSGWTLAGGLIHASRAPRKGSGARVSNTYAIYLKLGDSPGKLGVIRHSIHGWHHLWIKVLAA